MNLQVDGRVVLGFRVLGGGGGGRWAPEILLL